MTEKKREHGVALWKKESGNYMTHRGGLTEDDIAMLHSFKQGDRIIIFTNNKRDRDSSYHLRLLKAREQPKDNAPSQDDGI